MYGADSDALNAAAGELDRAADDLDRSARQLTSGLGAVRWLGNIAVAFSDLWNSRHQPGLATTAGYLRDAAGSLRRQADEQRRASESDGGGSQRWGITDLMAETVRQRGIADALADDLQRARDLSPAEQEAWWTSLTDEQRAALLDFRPGELTALSGLPADVLQQAQDNYTTSISDELVTSEVGVHGEAELNLKIVKIGGEFDVEQTTFRDGHVEIDVDALVKASGAEIDGSVGGGATFSFDSQAEADAWLQDLAKAALKGDVEGFLDRSMDHFESARIGADVGVHAEVEGPVDASVSASVGVEAEVDRDGDVTLSAHARVSGEMNTPVLGVKGQVEIGASVEFDGATPERITLSLDYEGAALGGHFEGLASNAGVLQSGHAEISLDLTDPQVAAAADVAVAALKRGDVVAAAQALDSVMDRSQVVVQQFVGSTSTSGFDAKVIKAELTSTGSVATQTYIKPPGGHFYEAN